MGYTTQFEGNFVIEPPLTKEQVDYLYAFNDTRRMKRDPIKAAKLSDDIRERVGLPLGVDGEFFVGSKGHREQDKDESIIDYNSEPRTQPGLWCQWIPSKDGTKLEWDEGEKFYSYTEWLEYMNENFFKPWGRKLTGAVSWQGEDETDFGLLTVSDIGVHALAGVRATDNLKGYY